MKHHHNNLALAVDTSGRAGSIAIGRGERILAERNFSGQLRHSAELFTAADEMLKQIDQKANDIEHIYITAGPGSFTGLRIGITMAKMMFLANNSIKIAAVSTMDALAENVIDRPAEQIGVVLDAKRGRFFVAAFEKAGGNWVKFINDSIMTADDFLAKIGDKSKSIAILGEGLVYYQKLFAGNNVEFFDKNLWSVTAGSVYKVGRKMALNGDFADVCTLLPAYLGEVDVVEKKLTK